MKVELELEDDFVARVRQEADRRGIAFETYAAQLFQMRYEQHQEEPAAALEARPDWQTKLTRARADLAAGRGVAHEEVVASRNSQCALSGRQKQ